MDLRHLSLGDGLTIETHQLIGQWDVAGLGSTRVHELLRKHAFWRWGRWHWPPPQGAETRAATNDRQSAINRTPSNDGNEQRRYAGKGREQPFNDLSD
jgi:hypothetical protein